MRRVLCSIISLLALAATTGMALAADIPRQMPPTKAPAYVAPYYNWTGLYLGINGGYGWGRSSWDGFGSGTFGTSGGLIGVTAGYNWQIPGGPWVFGLEGNVDWSNMRGKLQQSRLRRLETRNSWIGTARGRIGYAIDRVMPYVTGGLAVGDVRATSRGLPALAIPRPAGRWGGGIEAGIAPTGRRSSNISTSTWARSAAVPQPVVSQPTRDLTSTSFAPPELPVLTAPLNGEPCDRA